MVANEQRLIDANRLLRDPYFQEDRYPESHLLRMAIRAQPTVVAVKSDRKDRIISNADRIRAMSDDELTYFIMRDTLVCEAMSPEGVAACDWDCESCIGEWLKQPNSFPENFTEGAQRNGSDALPSL